MTDPEIAPVDADGSIASISELLAHALELEHAARAHYELLADSMAVHHNTGAEGLFRKLATLSAEHADAIAQRAAGQTLPRIAPWAFKWHCPGAPEGDDCLEDAVSYQMTTTQAIELALHNERRGQAFYRHVSTTATDPRAAALAEEMATEEAEHVTLLEALLAEQDPADADAPDDLDPPHTPD